jgi:branched-chain amino acid transport system ATP-binding protein
MALLELKLVVAGYGPIDVLNIVSLTVEEGEIVTIIGANGAGKTTTLMCISGAIPVREGMIVFGGQPIHGMPAHQVVAAGICQVPEGRKIFPQLTVRENLEMGAYVRADTGSIRQDMQRVFELFPILAERHTQKGGTLSGGEQQMLAIARALMGKPKLLMLDEPSLGLAPLVEARIFDVIRQLNQDGMSILLVEQNARAALRLAHRGYVMETGFFSIVDKAATLLHDPRIQSAYLGH